MKLNFMTYSTFQITGAAKLKAFFLHKPFSTYDEVKNKGKE